MFAAACSESSDNSGNNETPSAPECTSNGDCASRTDGKTECHAALQVCVGPQGSTPECTRNDDCASNAEGKTQCNTTYLVCVKPQVSTPECTSNDDCASNAEGKTQCNTALQVCVNPQVSGKCGDKMEWSDKYNVCVYPIASNSDLQALAQNWNSEGKGAYPTDSGEPIFLIKSSINMGTLDSSWKGIGSSLKPFSGIVYGEDKTITASFSEATGLFGYTKGAIIQNISFSFTANDSYGLIANNVEGGSFKSIAIEGSGNYSNLTSVGTLFNEINHAEFDNIQSTFSIDVTCVFDQLL